MRRLARILGCAAALACSTALLGCPLFHGDYPPSGSQCEENSDCFSYEKCGEAGVCELAPQDAEVPDGGGQ